MSIMPMSETIFNNKVIRSLRRGYLPFLLTLLFLLGSCQNKEDTGTLTVLLDEVVETSTVLEDKITTTTQEVVNSSFSSISDEEISNLF